MDASTQIALVEKVRQVFAPDDKVFLSFPFLTPVSFTMDALRGAIAPQTAADYQAASEFARAVNFVPHGLNAMADSDEYLWDVFEDVLSRGQPGTAPPNEGDDARRTAARALLYTQGEDGVRLESAAYTQYRRYRDALFVAQQDYAARRGSAETLAGDAKQAWDEIEAPRLRAVIDTATDEFETLGRRTEIDAALATERAAAAANPGARWAEWVEAFDPTVNMLVDTAGQRFAPSGFSPTNLTDDASWLKAEMERAELASLIAAAPAELPRNGDTSNVERVEFEYRAVTVNRPWFDVTALTSGIWRGAEGDPLLSDGGVPATGRLPAYVSALVLVRRVKVRTADRPAPEVIPDFRFTLAANALRPRRVIDPNLLRRLRPTPPPSPDTSPSPRLLRQLAAQNFTVAPVARQPVQRMVPATREGTMLLHRRGGLDRRGVVSPFIRFPRVLSAPTPSPGPTPAPAIETNGPADSSVAVLAFICKRLPRIPDPLPNLQWP